MSDAINAELVSLSKVAAKTSYRVTDLRAVLLELKHKTEGTLALMRREKPKKVPQAGR